MKLEKFIDDELTLSISLDEFKSFAEFLSAVTNVLVDYRNGLLESDYDEFKDSFDKFRSTSVGTSFDIRHFFTDLADVL